ncbi:hypothetical protein AAG570_005394 [Ranatra chinensis]|uniref:Uncharacterized protein n=1 Tax=Ranatra chinensis TaxID=642074 RepID=A0ABD0Y1V2_9HEMI
MASKRRNVFCQNKKQATTEIAFGSGMKSGGGMGGGSLLDNQAACSSVDLVGGGLSGGGGASGGFLAGGGGFLAGAAEEAPPPALSSNRKFEPPSPPLRYHPPYWPPAEGKSPSRSIRLIDTTQVQHKLRLKKAFKRRNMFYKNKTQETTEIVKEEVLMGNGSAPSVSSLSYSGIDFSITPSRPKCYM